MQGASLPAQLFGLRLCNMPVRNFECVANNLRGFNIVRLMRTLISWKGIDAKRHKDETAEPHISKHELLGHAGEG